MAYKVLGILIIGIAAVFSFLIIRENSPVQQTDLCSQKTPAQQLTSMIDHDFFNLKKSGQLPQEWDSISTVEIHLNSTLAKALLGKDRPQFKRVKEGTSFLEVEVMDMPDEENPGVIVQASLFDIKSKNKIFEIGRTYTMNDLNRVSSAKPQR